MSGEALGWARKRRPEGRSARHVLMLLADNANDWGWAWTSIGRLSADAGVSERQIKRILADLVTAGCLVRCDVEDRHTRRTRPCAYFFPVGGCGPEAAAIAALEDQVGGRVTWVSPWEGDAGDTLEGDMGVTGRVTPMSPLNEPSLEPEVSDEPSDAGAREAFDRIKAIWPVEGMDWTHVPRAWASFQAIVADGHPPDDLVHAASSAVGAAIWKKPPSLNAWLDEGRWEARLPGRGEVVRLDAPRGSTVPGEVLDAFAAVMGSDWTASWVAPAAFDADRRALIPRTRLAEERLRQAWPAEAMNKLDVRLGEAGTAAAAAGVG